MTPIAKHESQAAAFQTAGARFSYAFGYWYWYFTASTRDFGGAVGR